MNTNAPHIFNQHQPRLNFVGIDLETTGLDLSRDRIVQFAAVCKGLESLCININPECIIPKEASEVHKLTNESLKDAPTLRDALPTVMGAVALSLQPQNVLVGYRIRQYDWPLLQAQLAELGHIGPTLMMVDVYDLMCWEHRNLGKRRLVDMAAFYGVEFEGEAHNALADINATMALLEAFRARNTLDRGWCLGQERPKHAIPDDLKGDVMLVRMAILAGIRCDAEYSAWGRYLYRDRDSWAEGGPLRLGFGKYCGHTLGEVFDTDRRYCTWFIENCLGDANSATQKIFRQAWGMS